MRLKKWSALYSVVVHHDMRTHKASYYFHRFFPFAIGVFLLRMVVIAIFRPDDITTIVNGEEVETTFVTMLPALIIGLPMLIFGLWLWKNYFRVYMDEEVIKVYSKDNQEFKWSDIETVESVNWMWEGTIYRLKPRNKKRLFFFTDKPNLRLTNPFSPTYESKMKTLINKKKHELSI